MADISGYLQNIRNGARGEDVRDSIINALDKINKDNPSVIKPLNVTANGTYAGEGGIVYNPITVNVPEGASQALGLVDLKATENGEFEPDEGQAYRSVTVEVPQYVNEIMPDTKVIEYAGDDSQVYYAYADGYDGYSAVQVVAAGGGGGSLATFNVKFMSADGGTLLYEEAGVPYGGGAVYKGPALFSSGMRFVGWNPNPLNVKSNMVCRAKFENLGPYDQTQIIDDWVTIAKKCQENPDAYNIGQWKLLESIPNALTIATRDQNTINGVGGWSNSEPTNPINFSVKMQLVAKGVDMIEGENGYANTTWLAKFPLKEFLNYIWESRGQTMLLTGLFKLGNDFTHQNSWPENPFRIFLRDQFTEVMFPKDLLKYIKRVIKYTATFDKVNGGTFNTDTQTIDWFWVPSARELFGAYGNIPAYGPIETQGPIYYQQESDADFQAWWTSQFAATHDAWPSDNQGYQIWTRSAARDATAAGQASYPNRIYGIAKNSSNVYYIATQDDRTGMFSHSDTAMIGFCL